MRILTYTERCSIFLDRRRYYYKDMNYLKVIDKFSAVLASLFEKLNKVILKFGKIKIYKSC